MWINCGLCVGQFNGQPPFHCIRKHKSIWCSGNYQFDILHPVSWPNALDLIPWGTKWNPSICQKSFEEEELALPKLWRDTRTEIFDTITVAPAALTLLLCSMWYHLLLFLLPSKGRRGPVKIRHWHGLYWSMQRRFQRSMKWWLTRCYVHYLDTFLDCQNVFFF